MKQIKNNNEFKIKFRNRKQIEKLQSNFKKMPILFGFIPSYRVSLETAITNLAKKLKKCKEY